MKPLKNRQCGKTNSTWAPSRTFSTEDATKSSIAQPQVFEPQLNCRNMGGEGRGSDTVGGGWHMRPSFNPKWTVGDDKDTEIMPKN